MDILEAATNITIKAIENGVIKLDSVATRDQNEIVSKNDFNAKQISDFLNKIIKSFE